MAIKLANTYSNIGGFRFEKDIQLYDFDEAGKTIQNIKINGKEISIKEFKEQKGKRIDEKDNTWIPIISKN